MSNVIDLCPGMASEINKIKRRCIQGVVTSVDCALEVTHGVEDADLVFVDNFLFHGIGGRGANEASLNGIIAAMLCGCKAGTLVVTTALIGATKNRKTLQLRRQLRRTKNSFSWTGDDASGYMYRVVEC
jgi:hypothetical protein